MKKNDIQKTTADKVFLLINKFFLLVIFVVTLYPLVFVISASVSNPEAVSTGKMLLWPVGFTMKGYQYGDVQNACLTVSVNV